MSDRVLDMIVDSLKEFKEEMHNKLDRIESKVDGLVTKEECKLHRKTCIASQNIKKKEISIKRITAIGGVITGTVATSTGLVMAVIKLFL